MVLVMTSNAKQLNSGTMRRIAASTELFQPTAAAASGVVLFTPGRPPAKDWNGGKPKAWRP
jgi:hypothetical protein